MILTVEHEKLSLPRPNIDMMMDFKMAEHLGGHCKDTVARWLQEDKERD